MPPAGAASAAGRVLEVSGPGEELLFTLFPHLRGLRIARVEDTAEAVVISACCQAPRARCPACGSVSSRVHGGYARVVADGAAGGRPVLIALAVRRFRCPDPSCAKVTFAEQAEGLTSRYRRRSVPLTGMLAGFGLELAGRAGARLAAALGVSVHSSTVLRLVMALPDPEVSAAPEILGVDDFAFCKGHVYGTVLVDVATGDTVDLLPDREAGTLEDWLKARPGAKVICRDRAGAYAEGARDGAPGAVQVADRFHLWHNLGEAATKIVTVHRSCGLPGQDQPTGDRQGTRAGEDPAAVPAAPPQRTPAVPDPPGGLTDVHGRPRRLIARTIARHQQVHQLLAAGNSKAQIARTLGLDPATVTKFAAAATPHDLLTAATNRETKLDGFKAYLHQRFSEGITDATILHAEITGLGFTGTDQAVRRYIRPFRQAGTAPPPPPALPATRKITRWLMTRPEDLTRDQKTQLDAVTARCPHLAALSGHIRGFAEMMTSRTGDRDLDGWLARAAASGLPELQTLANGIRRDQAAVTNGLTLPYSSGKVEGTVNKIKMLKRQMYGRAGFTLLRKRVILHPG